MTSKMNSYWGCGVLLALLNQNTPGPLLHLFAGLPNILGVLRANTLPLPPLTVDAVHHVRGGAAQCQPAFDLDVTTKVTTFFSFR